MHMNQRIGNVGVGLHPATVEDLAFARELTRVNMREYYALYGLIWQPEAFDAEWSLRESYRVYKGDRGIGFLGFTVERDYLYVRDIQLIEAYRGEGVGAWIMGWVRRVAKERGCESVRLKVFKNNPATALYRRLGYMSVGEEAALLWMEQIVAS
jgi:GNAT superfamily N-acetyltransferase